MEFELISPKKSDNLISFPGIISLPSREMELSDTFFISDFSVTIIRPIKKITLPGDEISYVAQICKELKSVNAKNTIYIDLQISDECTNKITINKFDFINEQYILPLINDLKSAQIEVQIDSSLNKCKLGRDIKKRLPNVEAFQITFPNQKFITTLANKKKDIRAIYEEMITFLYLAITNQI